MNSMIARSSILQHVAVSSLDHHSPTFRHHSSAVVVAVDVAVLAAAERLHVDVAASAALKQTVTGNLSETGKDGEKHDLVTNVLDSEMVAVNSGD